MEALGVLVNPFMKDMEGVVVRENLESIPMIINHNGSVGGVECSCKGNSLLFLPIGAGGLAVEHDHPLLTPNGDMQEDISIMHKVDHCALVWGPALGGVRSRVEDWKIAISPAVKSSSRCTVLPNSRK